MRGVTLLPLKAAVHGGGGALGVSANVPSLAPLRTRRAIFPHKRKKHGTSQQRNTVIHVCWLCLVFSCPPSSFQAHTKRNSKHSFMFMTKQTIITNDSKIKINTYQFRVFGFWRFAVIAPRASRKQQRQRQQILHREHRTTPAASSKCTLSVPSTRHESQSPSAVKKIRDRNCL